MAAAIPAIPLPAPLSVLYHFVCLQGTGVNRGGLYIRDVQFYHAGEYRCIVKSTTDELTVIATLTVIGIYSLSSFLHTICS